ncbi:MAG: alpha-galactosidase [Clostridia bacterium]|nr:alpha-galactosidase [Clostridia bacterium]
MFSEYKPSYYFNVNAENNDYYRSRNTNYAEPSFVSDDGDAAFVLPGRGLSVNVSVENFTGIKTVRQRTTVTNTGSEAVTLDALSSVYVGGIGEPVPGIPAGRYVVHYAYSAWQGEGQWRHVPAEEMGLYPTYNHGTQTSIRFSSQGSWSTCHYEPVVMLEDTLLGKTWVFTCESGCGWYIEICVGGYRDDLSPCVFVSGAFEKNDGWHVELAPGESYESCPATVCCVEGGFGEAVKELIRYARLAADAGFADAGLADGVPPLCFNDYMNCIWALPTLDKSIPLVDAAASAGAEYYVIDAGWFGKDQNWGVCLGDWEINESLFGEGGLQGLFDYIASKGMKPGIWLEIESINRGSEYAKAHPEHLLYRHGHVIGSSAAFLDFRIREVREYIEGVIDMLYGMGVRFIKNDYNQTTGIGVDSFGEDAGISLAEGLARHTAAFLDFIDGIRAKYPDLILENCGSGAMRSDTGVLSHFHLQSVSDQEDHMRMPSVVAGLGAIIPPERLGVWTYPYPSPIDDRMTFERDGAFTRAFSDGKNVSFNMVSGLMGLMYLSGRIDCADENGRRLIREGCDLYKKYRLCKAGSSPVYPFGTFNMSDGGLRVYGLYNEKQKILMLAGWALPEEEKSGKNGAAKASGKTGAAERLGKADSTWKSGTAGNAAGYGNSGAAEARTGIDLSEYGDHMRLADVYPQMPGVKAELRGPTIHLSVPGPGTAIFAVVDLNEPAEEASEEA